METEETLFSHSHSVPFTLRVIRCHSICELALPLKQLKLAKTRPGRWHTPTHRQGPKRYSMLVPRKGFLLPNHLVGSAVLKSVVAHWQRVGGEYEY
jgi:hypothetical protein